MADDITPLHPDLAKDLQSLGSGETKYNYGAPGMPPRASVLEKFPNPTRERIRRGNTVQGIIQSVDIQAPEFSSLCPKTGQPDWATIVIKYLPNEWCVESKSLKLYLGEFRQFGTFHEAAVDKIGTDLVELLDPISLNVQGQFTPRGGIRFWPMYVYQMQQRIMGV